MALVPYTNNQLSIGANGLISPYQSGNLCVSIPAGNYTSDAANDTLEKFFYIGSGFLSSFNLLIGQTTGNIICHANMAISGVAGSPTGTIRCYSGQTVIGSFNNCPSDSSTGGGIPFIISSQSIKDFRISWQSNAVFGTATTFNLPINKASPT